MASSDNQQIWAPYPDTKDCSQGFCSLYCPQWCYMIFPPPPPLEFPREGSGAHFSPLVIAIIGMLASSFILISYYIVASKYCRNQDSSRRRSQRDSDEELNDSRNPSRHEHWQVATSGLDEALIKSITVYKYKRGGGLIEGTDCAVCLGEFQENESLRLLPKCSHAFHLPCIDMWLKSHSNCPLCRASVVLTSLPPQLPSLMLESIPDHASSIENRHESDTAVAVIDLETGEEELSLASGSHVSKSPVEALPDVDASHERHTIIEIRDEEIWPIRRTFSMDSCQDRISIADALPMSMGEDCQVNDEGNLHFPMDVGSSEQHGEEYSKTNSRSRVLHSVMNPTAMKRSSSSGRLLTRHGRGRNSAFLI